MQPRTYASATKRSIRDGELYGPLGARTFPDYNTIFPALPLKGSKPEPTKSEPLLRKAQPNGVAPTPAPKQTNHQKAKAPHVEVISQRAHASTPSEKTKRDHQKKATASVGLTELKNTTPDTTILPEQKSAPEPIVTSISKPAKPNVQVAPVPPQGHSASNLKQPAPKRIAAPTSKATYQPPAKTAKVQKDDVSKELQKRNTRNPLVVPDQECPHIIHEGTYTGIVVNLPLARVLRCPYKCARTVTKPPPIKGRKSPMVTLIEHMKSKHGATKVVHYFVCRFCGLSQNTEMRSNQSNIDKWSKSHSAVCAKLLGTEVYAQREGRSMCGDCGDRFPSLQALESHHNYCNGIPAPGAIQPLHPPPVPQPTAPTDDPSITATSRKFPNLPQRIVDEKFDCLSHNAGLDAYLTDEVIEWALGETIKTAGVTCFPPSIFPHLTVPENLALEVVAEVADSPIAVFPVCTNMHWQLVIIRQRPGGEAGAIYINPLGGSHIPDPIYKTFENKLAVKCEPVDMNSLGLPIQTDGVNCGPLICLYASTLLDPKHKLKATSGEEAREELRAMRDKMFAWKKIPSLISKQITPPGQKVNKVPEPPSKKEIRAFNLWYQRERLHYERTGKRFVNYEWIVDQACALASHITRGRREQFRQGLAARYEIPYSGITASKPGQSIRQRKMRKGRQVNTGYLNYEYCCDKKKVFRHLTNNTQTECPIELSKLHQHFAEAAKKPTIDGTKLLECGAQLPLLRIPKTFDRPLSLKEVQGVLKRANKKTAAGPDGLQNKDWVTMDPQCHFLYWVFAEARAHRKIPTSWKDSRTILLYKAKDPFQPRNWRPICLMRTICKLYGAVWNNRLRRIKGMTSEAQKGFTAANGTAEHGGLAKDLLESARARKAGICMIWLDLTNAFGSVPHGVITYALEKFGLPWYFVDIIRDMYKGCTTTVTTAKGSTYPIPLECGTKQGDTISPTLFNIALELLLRGMIARSEGHVSLGKTHKVMAFADDLLLIGNTAESLQAELNILVEQAKGLNLVFNPSKCCSLTLLPGFSRPAESTLTIEGKPIQCLNKGESYKYLGTQVGSGTGTSIADAIESFEVTGMQLAKSDLRPLLRIDALKTFVETHLDYTFRNTTPPVKQIRDLEEKQEKILKCATGLPRWAPIEPLFYPKTKGGLGCLRMMDRAHLLFLIGFLQRCWSSDTATKDATLASLRESVALHTERADVELQEALEYLQCSPSEFRHGLHQGIFRLQTIFYHFCKSARATFKRLELREVNEEVVLVVQSYTDDMPTVVREDPKRTLLRKLKKIISERIFAKWTTSDNRVPRQMESFAQCKDSNWFLQYQKYGMGGPNEKFLLFARVRATELVGDRHMYCIHTGSSYCRKCTPDTVRANWDTATSETIKQYKETLQHTLQNCIIELNRKITYRHDDALAQLAEATANGAKRDYRMTIDKTTDYTERQWRPDLVIRERAHDHNGVRKTGQREVIIVDVAIRYEKTKNHMLEKARDKEEKYEKIAEHYRKKGRTVSNHALVVGSLGGWIPSNYETFTALGIDKKLHKPLMRAMTKTAVDWSRWIYYNHILGDSYTGPKPWKEPVPKGRKQRSETDESETDKSEEEDTADSEGESHAPHKKNKKSSKQGRK